MEVKILRGPLDERIYLECLENIDIMLIPYNIEKYKSSTSGIMVEALESLIPSICTKGTWAGDIISEAKINQDLIIGNVFCDENEIPGLILEMSKNIHKYRQNISTYLNTKKVATLPPK